jgi:hypothetical protein
MKIREKCSCGASFYASGEEATALFKAWVKRHTCPETSQELHRDYESTSLIGFSADYKGTGLDLPAKEYDPWED